MRSKSYVIRLCCGVMCAASMIGCNEKEQEFNELYRDTNVSNVSDMAPKYKRYYPQMVNRLDSEEWLKIASICVAQGHWCAAVHLTPYMRNQSDEKQVLLASMVAVFSHGNNEEAARCLRSLPNGITGKAKAIAEDTVREINDRRQKWGVEDARELGVVPDEWAGMDVTARWNVIVKSVSP